jgi:hypothetical protein
MLSLILLSLGFNLKLISVPLALLASIRLEKILLPFLLDFMLNLIVSKFISSEGSQNGL